MQCVELECRIAVLTDLLVLLLKSVGLLHETFKSSNTDNTVTALNITKVIFSIHIDLIQLQCSFHNGGFIWDY